jgi:negative regulator of flagellin synthesis FlgM
MGLGLIEGDTMIISNDQVQNVLKVYGKRIRSEGVAGKQDVVKPFARQDKLQISGAGRIKQKAIQAAKEAPDVRQDRVEYLKEAISSGTYEISDYGVAEKMLYWSLVDKLL